MPKPPSIAEGQTLGRRLRLAGALLWTMFTASEPSEARSWCLILQICGHVGMALQAGRAPAFPTTFALAVQSLDSRVRTDDCILSMISTSSVDSKVICLEEDSKFRVLHALVSPIADARSISKEILGVSTSINGSGIWSRGLVLPKVPAHIMARKDRLMARCVESPETQLGRKRDCARSCELCQSFVFQWFHVFSAETTPLRVAFDVAMPTQWEVRP